MFLGNDLPMVLFHVIQIEPIGSGINIVTTNLEFLFHFGIALLGTPPL